MGYFDQILAQTFNDTWQNQFLNIVNPGLNFLNNIVQPVQPIQPLYQTISNMQTGQTIMPNQTKPEPVKLTGERYHMYDDIINEAAQTYGLDPKLLRAVIKQESDYNNSDQSHVGASGLMQLMPETAKELGVTNVWDPRQNIMGGSKYLAQQLKRFNGDVKLALAAYNAGPGRVIKAGYQVPNIAETQHYVNVILNKWYGRV